MVRQGTVFKLLADLDPKGRMARLLVSLPDPLDLGTVSAEGIEGDTGDSENRGQGKILLNSFVRVRIDAGQLEKVFVLPEKALREGSRLWLVNADGVLSFREARVLWRRVNEVLVDAKIAPDERVIISRLQSPVSGMKVREEEK
ncbi:MAG: hypothetical protein D3903_21160 [Candidatus Electrothrix sp. GM3_4]|nr:hypothetical protein [Candidatus Electrothrix sp. GM3_4]